MSQNNSHILYVGLDVAKSALQLDLAKTQHALSNDAKGHAQLLKLLTAHPGAHVICEATGGYEKPVVRATVLPPAGGRTGPSSQAFTSRQGYTEIQIQEGCRPDCFLPVKSFRAIPVRSVPGDNSCPQ